MNFDAWFEQHRSELSGPEARYERMFAESVLTDEHPLVARLRTRQLGADVR